MKLITNVGYSALQSFRFGRYEAPGGISNVEKSLDAQHLFVNLFQVLIDTACTVWNLWKTIAVGEQAVPLYSITISTVLYTIHGCTFLALFVEKNCFCLHLSRISQLHTFSLYKPFTSFATPSHPPQHLSLSLSNTQS